MNRFQEMVAGWMLKCMGKTIAANKDIRNYRFLEESLELVQACGCTKERVLELVDYTYGRPLGEPKQEVGGVMVTLAALCNAHNINVNDEAYREIERILQPDVMIKIREKQKSKIGESALPGAG